MKKKAEILLREDTLLFYVFHYTLLVCLILLVFFEIFNCILYTGNTFSLTLYLESVYNNNK